MICSGQLEGLEEDSSCSSCLVAACAFDSLLARKQTRARGPSRAHYAHVERAACAPTVQPKARARQHWVPWRRMDPWLRLLSQVTRCLLSPGPCLPSLDVRHGSKPAAGRRPTSENEVGVGVELLRKRIDVDRQTILGQPWASEPWAAAMGVVARVEDDSEALSCWSRVVERRAGRQRTTWDPERPSAQTDEMHERALTARTDLLVSFPSWPSLVKWPSNFCHLPIPSSLNPPAPRRGL